MVDAWRVAWTRGDGCRPLAELLGDSPGRPIESNLRQVCVSDRVDLLVTRRLTSFDLVPLVVPQSVALGDVASVSVAVSGGPHSDLAASVAARIAARLGVPGELATAYRTANEHEDAMQRLERIGGAHPELDRRAIEASSAAALVDPLTADTLLVLGAPGGSWLQRQLFGPGHRLAVAAPGGVVIVRSAPRRCFQDTDPDSRHAVGPQLAVREALRLFADAVIPVAEGGKLVGIVRAATLRSAHKRTAIGDVMEPAVAVSATEPTEAAAELYEFLDGGPVPVVDEQGYFIGTIAAPTPL